MIRIEELECLNHLFFTCATTDVQKVGLEFVITIILPASQISRNNTTIQQYNNTTVQQCSNSNSQITGLPPCNLIMSIVAIARPAPFTMSIVASSFDKMVSLAKQKQKQKTKNKKKGTNTPFVTYPSNQLTHPIRCSWDQLLRQRLHEGRLDCDHCWVYFTAE